MTEDLQNLLIIRGHIAGLPAADRKGIELAAQKLREVVKAHGEHGLVAIALVVAELQMET